MTKYSQLCMISLVLCASSLAVAADRVSWPSALPVYDHIVIVVEENKDFEQILGARFDAPYIRKLAAEGATFERMFAEEHFSQGNYFWLFSGSNQNVGFLDQVPSTNGTTVATSSNLRFADFPTDYTTLPTVAFVIPNLNHDMHNGKPDQSIPAGDRWLQQNFDGYYQWAKTHNSLLIVTFDENDDQSGYYGLTNPLIGPNPRYSLRHNRLLRDIQNWIVTIFAGAHIKPGWYAEGKGITHVNILRTIEAMYGLPKSGAQQPNAAGGGIADEMIITDVFEPVR
jgi:phosphatidylinositol-3-phosphatase